jgi:DNA polymerase
VTLTAPAWLKDTYVLDYETKSEVELSDVGPYEYARHPSTEIICVSCSAADERGTEPDLWINKISGDVFFFLEVLSNPKYKLAAYNAFFERVITQFVLGRKFPEVRGIPISRWHDIAALVATHALPRKLEGACDALKLDVRKDPEGKRLVRKYCKPRKPTKNNPSLWNTDEEGLRRLGLYCQTDVKAEREILWTLPPLTPMERKIWKQNQKTNTRGVLIDRVTVKKVLKLMRQEQALIRERVDAITQGKFEVTQIAKVREWCELEGLALPNLQKKTVDDALRLGMGSSRVRELLGCRQALSKTSTAKYEALERRTRTDGRLRDTLMYHGASTGRDTGSGAQVHNFPRNVPADIDQAIEDLRTGDLEWVRGLRGTPMAVFSSVLRGMLAATPGKALYCADFNAIEARVVFWLAGHTAGLELFRGRDPYREMAAEIYRVKLEDVTDEQREVGKRAILGCGFGMGWKKFMLTCEQFGTPVTPELAKRAVTAYREKHKPVTQLWKNYEYAACSAVMKPGRRFTVNRVSWFVRGNFLYAELPSRPPSRLCISVDPLRSNAVGSKTTQALFLASTPEDETVG